jgi:sterile alpha motif and leucine zipper-containing kinase AZK
VVLWELITGEVPFKGIEEFQIAFLVVEKDYVRLTFKANIFFKFTKYANFLNKRLPIPNGCPPVMSSLMQSMWQSDPKARPTFKHILSTLDQIDLDGKALF